MRYDEHLWNMRQTTAFDRGCVKTRKELASKKIDLSG